MTRFGSLASAIVAKLEAEAAPPPPLRATEPTRSPSACGRSRGETGQPFQRKGRV